LHSIRSALAVYGGYILAGDGIRPQNEKLNAIRNWPLPTSVAGVRAFLGRLPTADRKPPVEERVGL